MCTQPVPGPPASGAAADQGRDGGGPGPSPGQGRAGGRPATGGHGQGGQAEQAGGAAGQHHPATDWPVRILPDPANNLGSQRGE